jgi:thiamine pyrophosphokinase
MTVLVFANGTIVDPTWILPWLKQATTVIAADGGSAHLQRLDFRPNLVIGDLDSISPDVQNWLDRHDVPQIKHPTHKDETDLELALLYAAATFAEPIRVFGALGGRLDQELANILLLAHPQLRVRDVQLVEQWQRAWLVVETTTIHGAIGDTVSLVPLAGDAHVARTTGLAWELRDSVLTFGQARGVSNVLSAETATVTLSSGLVLCVHVRHTWAR